MINIKGTVRRSGSEKHYIQLQIKTAVLRFQAIVLYLKTINLLIISPLFLCNPFDLIGISDNFYISVLLLRT